jgi:putative PEP-CTERM system TPR-repeat lipoprotein
MQLMIRMMGILLLCMATGYPAAAQEPDNTALYEDAVRLLNEGETSAALIQAKNALLENPMHLPSRILLGNIYLLQGRGLDAQKELNIALELGAARDSVMLPLGDALLLQLKYQEILDIIVADTPRLRQVEALYTLRGRAHYGLGELGPAQDDFERAQALDSRALGPVLGLIQVALRKRNLPEAEIQAARALDLAPESAEAWYNAASVKLAANDTQGALEAYTRTLELAEGHMRARMARARLYLQLEQYELALADTQWATEAQEYDPEPPFLASQALARLGREQDALAALKEAGGRLAQLKTDYILTRPGLLRVAAMLSFAQGNLEQANYFLALYVDNSPYDVEMRKVLGRVRLQLGDPGGAIRALYPAQRAGRVDAELLYLLGDALLRNGRYAEALNLLEQSIAADTETAHVLTKLALSRMGLGESELALADLKKALAMDDAGRSMQSGIILTTIYIKRGQHEEAMQVARTLLNRDPGNPVLHNLVGLVYLEMTQPGLAEMSFQEAHHLAPTYTPAIYNLALLDMSRGDYAAAEARYKSVLAISDEAVLALLGMSEIALKRQDEQAAISWLTKAVAQKKDTLEPNIRLINLYLATDQIDKAFVETDIFKRRHPEAVEAHVLYARVMNVRGETDVAIKSYRNAVRFAGFSGEDLLQIAAAQQRLKDFDGALITLQKALETDIALAAHAATVSLLIQRNDLDGAMAAADLVLQEMPDSSAGLILRGDVQLAQKQYQSALESYQQAYKRNSGRDSLVGIYKARTLLGEHAKARAALQDWLVSHPQDAFVRRNLAVAYITVGDQDAARVELERLYDEGERGSVVLANLARTYQLSADPRARDYAKRALDANPSWSVALDTYGWILVTEGEPEAGLSYLREAVSRDSNPVMRYHLAAALSELDRKDEARVELRSVLKSRASPELMEVAQALFDEIARTPASVQVN